MRLMFPLNEGEAPAWPTTGANGVTHYPPADILAIRKYTFRNIDVAAGTFDVDFVLHDNPGPGASFAASAKIGDVIGLGGPGGSSAPLDRSWYLLVGDETALPAISRLLEALPPDARGRAIIEVDSSEERQRLTAPQNFEFQWLYRNGESPGDADRLADAVRSTQLPSADESRFVWVGCEYDDFKTIRDYVRNDCGLSKHESLIVSYWRRSVSG